jgi:hypothetical protein
MNYQRFGLPMMLSIYGVGYSMAAYELHNNNSKQKEMKYLLGIIAMAYFGKSFHIYRFPQLKK